YEADMRYILDTYIHADESKIVSELSNMSLVELLADGKKLTPDDVWRELNCDDSAKPEVIENNITYEITQRENTNAVYYGKLSEMLKALIRRRKNEAVDYAEYLAEITDLARKVLHPEGDTELPTSIKESPARCAIYYYLNMDEALTLRVDEVIKASKEHGFKEDERKTRQICRSIYKVLLEAGRERQRAEAETRGVFEIVKVQPEYDS
ncbi:MAG: hypothetical protein IJL18_06975, partial [Synergistaceae bacterium]|nr:hypothetical protein [Synergistaceae bacterium]